MKDSNIYALTVRFGFYDNFFAAAGGTSLKIYNCRERLSFKNNRRRGALKEITNGDASSYCFTTMLKKRTMVEGTKYGGYGKDESYASDDSGNVRPLKDARKRLGKSQMMKGSNLLNPELRVAQKLYPKNANAKNKGKTSGFIGLNDQEKAFPEANDLLGNPESLFDGQGKSVPNQSNANKGRTREDIDKVTIVRRPSGFSGMSQTHKTEKEHSMLLGSRKDSGVTDDAKFFEE
jgi:hypothetical protein